MKLPNFLHIGFLSRWMKPSKHRNPYRDWFFIACLFACVVVLVLALDGILYYAIDRGAIFKTEPVSDSAPLKIDRQEIESVSGYYYGLEESVKNLISATSTSVDPGL